MSGEGGIQWRKEEHAPVPAGSSFFFLRGVESLGGTGARVDIRHEHRWRGTLLFESGSQFGDF